MVLRHGTASWPGILSIESASYVCAHGITPGSIQMQVHPQPIAPQVEGTFAITDVVGTLTLPGCRISNLREVKDRSGTYWILDIQDRRWKWLAFGNIQGQYNQLDAHGKLIPWTIQSPAELARKCLDLMGEVNYRLDLPPGLDSSIGRNQQTFLPTGVNFPLTGTNPPVNWNLPPAQALQQLCDLFGRRIVRSEERRVG